MSDPSLLASIRRDAISDLQQLARHLEKLVLEPQAGLHDGDLAALKAHRDALGGMLYVGNSKRVTRGLSGSTEAEVLSNEAYEQFSDRTKAREFLTRLDHHLALLGRLYGPQVAE